jgi:hemolysin activation/secretion protein
MLTTISKTTIAALAVVSAATAQAATTLPDAGQTSREVQRNTELFKPGVVAPLIVGGEAQAAPGSDAAASSVRIFVKEVRVVGSKAFSAAGLEFLVKRLHGGEHSLAEINTAVSTITTWYRERGFVVARAYLPAQEINDGVLVVNVLEGLVGAQTTLNRSQLMEPQVKQYLSQIVAGEAVQARIIDRALLVLADTPGVGGARASLQPGASVGTTDLLIEIDPGVPYSATVEADNFGNRYTGEYRLGASLAVNSPLKRGDQLTVRALGSDQNMTYARASYQVPVGGDGLRSGVAYFDTRYRLVQEYSPTQSHGTATGASAFATYPFIRSQSANLFGTLTAEQKKFQDEFDNPATRSDKQINLINLGLAGSAQDTLLGGGSSSVDVSLVSGTLSMDAASLTQDEASGSANTAGQFSKLGYSLGRQQRLNDTDTMLFQLSGQIASKNLNSSEKFSLGGANGVRAYPQGEASGDMGWMLNLEYRRALAPQLQGFAFYDAGSVTINRNPYLLNTDQSPADNSRALAGAGLGLSAQYKSMQFKASVAWQTQGGTALAEPASATRNPRFWVQMSDSF